MSRWTSAGALLSFVVLAALGYLAGALPLSGVEPHGGTYVDCGPALFGRESPLAHPTCDAAFSPFPQLSVALIALAVACAALAVGLATRRSRSHG